MNTHTFTVTLEHVTPAYAGEHTFVVSKDSCGGYYAKSRLFGGSKTYANAHDAIRSLALASGAIVTEIVEEVEDDNSGYFEFNWEWISAHGECEGICQQWIYADDLAQACAQFESFHGPLGKDEFGLSVQITKIRFEKHLPL